MSGVHTLAALQQNVGRDHLDDVANADRQHDQIVYMAEHWVEILRTAVAA